jgi:FemAB-related protein (PEP-CTERM system-associated)
MTPLILRTLDDRRDPRWDAFVRAQPDGCFYQLLGWRRTLERIYGPVAHYLYAERGGEITGVLPLFESGSWPFTRALVSVPIAVGGGIVAQDHESATLLREGARALAEREKAAYVEYKCKKPLFDNLKTKGGLYSNFTQQIFASEEEQFAAIPRKIRSNIRTAEDARLKGDYNRTDLDAFYDLYALSLRNLGTPMFPKELFVGLLEEFEEHEVDFVSVRESGRIIGVVMNFYFRDVILPFFAGTCPEARDVAVNNFVYWHMLRTGYARGYRLLDMGRSKLGSGPHQFKKNFGFQEVPLTYEYDLVGVPELPNVNPTNPKYARAIGAWQKLPVEVSKWLGPLINQRLPL